MERRTYKTEIRAEEGAKVVRGHAAVFNSDSEDLGGFIERISPGFFNDVLKDDVRALFNHDSNMILGRTKSGTLRLGIDQVGLYYEYDDPDTTYSRDLIKSLTRGDVTQSSFGFTVEEDSWDEIEGQTVRTLLKAGRLYDVSPVTYPAYPDTSAAKRSLDEYRSHLDKKEIDQLAVDANKVERNKIIRNIS